MGLIKTEGITLQSFPFQDQARIFKIFSKDFGVVSLIAKHLSIKKPVHLALTTPFCHGEFLYKKSTGEIFKFSEGSIFDPFLDLKKNLDSLVAAALIGDALVKISLNHEESSGLFLLLQRYLKALENHPDALFTLAASFYAKLLLKEGVLHLSKTCNLCKKPSAVIASGECLCNEHTQFPCISFTPADWSVLFHLIQAKTFTELCHIQLSKEFFEEKIATLFQSLV